jgi:CRP/FNR family cyclic AMP-dependent transcriptional regulator
MAVGVTPQIAPVLAVASIGLPPRGYDRRAERWHRSSLRPPRMPSAAAPPSVEDLPEPLRVLARRGDVRHYRKGTLLIQEGDSGDTLFIILAGRLRVFGSGERGREITYGSYGAGEYLGEMSLDGGPRSASVIVLEAATCAVVTRHTLRQHIAEHPEFAFELLAKVIRRARVATLNAKQLALNDVYGRLVLLLNSLAVAQPDGTRRIEERLTHQEMSNRLGCSREMVSRLMKDLEAGEFVNASAGLIQILRPLPARW